jgi:hypothetical protein
MKIEEQHRMIATLREHRSAMDRQDDAAFEMLAIRDREDEELDAIALRMLNQLYTKHVAKHSREELEARWRKLTGG